MFKATSAQVVSTRRAISLDTPALWGVVKGSGADRSCSPLWSRRDEVMDGSRNCQTANHFYMFNDEDIWDLVYCGFDMGQLR